MIVYLQMIDSPESKSKFEKIYDTYRGLMYYVAHQILGHQQDAEDAVYAAFVKIAENIEKISDPVCPKTRSLVVIIVKNQSIDMLRSRKRHENVELMEDMVCFSPDYEVEDSLTRCILKLPQRYQSVILLKYSHGYTLREIADMMGLSLAAATKLDQRAKKKLEKLCKEEGIL